MFKLVKIERSKWKSQKSYSEKNTLVMCSKIQSDSNVLHELAVPIMDFDKCNAVDAYNGFLNYMSDQGMMVIITNSFHHL